jgi:hypothetical protein
MTSTAPIRPEVVELLADCFRHPGTELLASDGVSGWRHADGRLVTAGEGRTIRAATLREVWTAHLTVTAEHAARWPSLAARAPGAGAPFTDDAEVLAWYRATYDDDQADDELVLARMAAWRDGQSFGPDAQGIPRRQPLPPITEALLS